MYAESFLIYWSFIWRASWYSWAFYLQWNLRIKDKLFYELLGGLKFVLLCREAVLFLEDQASTVSIILLSIKSSLVHEFSGQPLLCRGCLVSWNKFHSWYIQRKDSGPLDAGSCCMASYLVGRKVETLDAHV